MLKDRKLQRIQRIEVNNLSLKHLSAVKEMWTTLDSYNSSVI
jgi:hypothetical protein